MSSVIVVTGAASGIGRELFELAAARGHVTIGLDRVEVAPTDGGRVVTCDLRHRDDIRRTIEGILAEHGAIDVLVNNAVVGVVAPLEHVEATLLADLVDVNLAAPLLLTQAVLPGMRARGRGRILNVSSISSRVSVPGTSAYAASKAGLERASRILAEELRGSGVSVGVVRIGRTRTSGYLHASEELRARLERGELRGYEPILDVLWGVLGGEEYAMNAREVAAALLDLALSDREEATIAPLAERAQVALASLLPARALGALLASTGRRSRSSFHPVRP